MFTVKHRGADGVETIYSAEKVEVVYPGPAEAGSGYTSNWTECGIFLDREPPSLPTPGEQATTRFSKEIILFGGDQTSDAMARCGGKVWVMNDAGATVATYEL